MKDLSNYYYKEMPNENFFVDIFENCHKELGSTFERHWHEHLQFFYFTIGEAILNCSHIQIKVHTGDLVIINSNELHDCTNLCCNLKYYIIRVDLEFLFSNQVDTLQTKFLIPLAQNLILFKNLVRDDKNINSCIEKIIVEYFERKLGYELAIKGYFYDLIVNLMRNYVEEILTQKQFDDRINNLARFDDIIKYIENNYYEKIKLEELAKMANMSTYYFVRSFKQITGRSPIDYINKLRIDKAFSLLKGGKFNVTEAALDCGFNDVNYFSRLFKKYNKMSPSEAKKLSGKK
ncbi:AraC family transcriptional regulator [Clostridium saccharobutylicum]|uniref:HTH-type transcriptional regulator YdeC n=1 Tax=Clostridium saccharobutylicum DSM 13864 TaxID=1345695 RepID=U5MU08_CLOSA|nr:AraC family transcriptional regulator [Clostridium saccharobutylicum]AGX43151.1 HTH-type transcriptional regulator YdeC [Clostridium saccharobutylicum DSM 13864]AQR90448.1 HTH-type transcriptional activator RhaS [Clostridium saccharobutylicum]AQS00354.1 HTH-type transcriptional activator RhaS [Clostridium saccharobutylicum]AQS14337.1 HTH-type transcriptional activator RhaS [Clostridium saccharobutylicum]MBA2906619.1 AraC-like DNA-binding protein [Clostridium saccharobutylicum]